MAIVRWNPWQMMPSTILSDDEWLRPFEERPEMDIYEDNDNVVVKLKLPGYTSDSVKITLVGDTLTVNGEQEQKEEKKEGKTWHRKEIRTESFSTSVTLPKPVKSEDANAKFQDGILTLTMPKAEEAKPKTIQIKAESN